MKVSKKDFFQFVLLFLRQSGQSGACATQISRFMSIEGVEEGTKTIREITQALARELSTTTKRQCIEIVPGQNIETKLYKGEERKVWKNVLFRLCSPQYYCSSTAFAVRSILKLYAPENGVLTAGEIFTHLGEVGYQTKYSSDPKEAIRTIVDRVRKLKKQFNVRGLGEYKHFEDVEVSLVKNPSLKKRKRQRQRQPQSLRQLRRTWKELKQIIQQVECAPEQKKLLLDKTTKAIHDAIQCVKDAYNEDDGEEEAAPPDAGPQPDAGAPPDAGPPPDLDAETSRDAQERAARPEARGDWPSDYDLSETDTETNTDHEQDVPPQHTDQQPHEAPPGGAAADIDSEEEDSSPDGWHNRRPVTRLKAARACRHLQGVYPHPWGVTGPPTYSGAFFRRASAVLLGLLDQVPPQEGLKEFAPYHWHCTSSEQIRDMISERDKHPGDPYEFRLKPMSICGTQDTRSNDFGSIFWAQTEDAFPVPQDKKSRLWWSCSLASGVGHACSVLQRQKIVRPTGLPDIYLIGTTRVKGVEMWGTSFRFTNKSFKIKLESEPVAEVKEGKVHRSDVVLRFRSDEGVKAIVDFPQDHLPSLEEGQQVKVCGCDLTVNIDREKNYLLG